MICGSRDRRAKDRQVPNLDALLQWKNTYGGKKDSAEQMEGEPKRSHGERGWKTERINEPFFENTQGNPRKE